MNNTQLALPKHWDPSSAENIRRVEYQKIASDARDWAKRNDIRSAATDKTRICLLLVDMQNTFCLPGFELYVGGRSGTGAVDDTKRLVEFAYRNLHKITAIAPTMDTHMAMQIFHESFLVDASGNHPVPMTMVSVDDVLQGKWMVDPKIAGIARGNYAKLQRHLIHYCKSLAQKGKYSLTIWPYHAMLGGIGHALVPAIDELAFFHSIARNAQVEFEIKGGNPLTENYSVFQPEVLDDSDGIAIVDVNARFVKRLLEFDAIVIAGQAKSHCVAWTIDDLLTNIMAQDPALAKKVYLLEDCSSPVVVPGIIDFTDQAEAAFQRFAKAGMNIVRSTDPVESWSGMNLK